MESIIPSAAGGHTQKRSCKGHRRGDSLFGEFCDARWLEVVGETEAGWLARCVECGAAFTRRKEADEPSGSAGAKRVSGGAA